MSPTQPLTVPSIEIHPIPPAIAEEIDTFEAEALRLLSGDVSSDLFRPFRLQYGIYGQRQAGVQMVRVKIPFGGISANQLRRVAELVDRRYFADPVAALDQDFCVAHQRVRIARNGDDDLRLALRDLARLLGCDRPFAEPRAVLHPRGRARGRRVGAARSATARADRESLFGARRPILRLCRAAFRVIRRTTASLPNSRNLRSMS